MATDIGGGEPNAQGNSARMSAVERQGHISTLDGVRGIAALTVFFHHGLFASVDSQRWPLILRPLIGLSHFGQYGVDLFFVLSGYLITSILIENKNSNHYFKEFYVKRFTRILPVYLIALIGMAVFSPSSSKYIILCFLFIANFSRWFKVDSVGPFWTLAIEEQFYAIWPFVVRKVSLDKLHRIALGVIIAEPILRLIDIATGRRYFLYTMFHCDGLAFGALLACQVLDRNYKGRVRKNALALVVGLLLYALYVASDGTPVVGAVFGALDYTGIGLIAYAIVGLAVCSPNARSVRWLGAPGLVFFGQISYCSYMAHLFIFMGFDSLFGPLDRGSMQYISIRFLAVLAATIILSVISRHVVELPAMSLRKRLMGGVTLTPTPLIVDPATADSKP